MRQMFRRDPGELFYHTLADSFAKLPSSQPKNNGVTVEKDIRYREPEAGENGEDSLLDIYRPTTPQSDKLPIVLYLHGGGFRILSKETHWIFGLRFARAGYLTLVPNYRLAPKSPFPIPATDACTAYQWAVENAERLGGDPDQIIVAGESAGANLATVVTLAACTQRSEEWAKPLADLPAPAAVLPSCGILQVSDPTRFVRGRKLPKIVLSEVSRVSRSYLVGGSGPWELADPLVELEGNPQISRALPPFLISCGTWDPICEDSQRLADALGVLGVDYRLRLYPKASHAFHAFIWTKNSKKWWRETMSDLAEVVPAASQ